MDCPPQSPDLNIIRALWDDLYRTEQKAANKQRRGLNVLQEAWKTIPEDHLKT